MQNVTVDRDNWAARADEVGLRLEEIALLTGKSFSAVYRYKQGTRNPKDEWVKQVGLLIASRSLNRGEVA